MQTDNLELKKLVYLYLMNYAKSQPDMAIMAVNSFVKASSKFICLLMIRGGEGDNNKNKTHGKKRQFIKDFGKSPQHKTYICEDHTHKKEVIVF